MKTINIFKYILALLTLLPACSSPSVNGYTDDPMPKVTSPEPEEINFNIKLVDHFGKPISHAEVGLETNTFRDSGVTNSDGALQLTSQRVSGESFIFKFLSPKFSSTEIISNLPTSLNQASLVFEVVSPTKIRLSHYEVEGLYR